MKFTQALTLLPLFSCSSKRKHAYKAFTLLELMIALAVSSLLMVGFATVYISVKNNYRLQQAVSDVAESGRFSVYTLNQRLRTAGFSACSSISENAVNLSAAIQGYDSTHMPDWLQGQVVAGTDAVVIGSCVNDENLSDKSQFTLMAYYIGDTARKNSQGKKIYALYEKPQNGQRQELVAGVSRLKLYYGVINDNQTAIVAYQSANEISDWQSVRSVVVDLLVDSIEPVLKHPLAYLFNGQVIVPTDLLLYKPWDTYINLRELHLNG